MAIRLGIGLKLGITSTLLILLSGGVIVSRQIAMSRIDAAASDVHLQAEILKEAEKVSTLLSAVRSNATELMLSFTNIDNDTLLKQTLKDIGTAQAGLDRLLVLETHDDDREEFRQLKRRFDEIGAAVADIARSEAAQLDAVDARPAIRLRARSAFSMLAVDLGNAGKNNAAQRAETLDLLLDQINLASLIYVTEGDPKQLTMIKAMEESGQRTLGEIKASIGDDDRAGDTLVLAGQAFEAYVASIRAGLAEIQARDEIIRQRSKPAFTVATAVLKHVTHESRLQAEEAEQESAQALDSGMTQILIFSIVAIGASIAAAAYSALGIAAPIKRMSEAMEGLSGGDLTTAIPYAGRGDEVGDQSRALTVFRDSLAEAEHQRELRLAEDRAAEERRKAEMRALADQFESAIGAVVDTVASAATELQQAAETLSSTAEETSAQAAAVAAAAGLATTNVQSVASAVEELSASARAIGERLRHSTQMTERAVSEVDNTNGQMGELRACADQIGSIVSVIDTIAGQTNLLALNATIESARAGAAGRGFAVVAQEVKELAGQTAKATADISERISGIQDSTGDVLGAITGFSRTIVELNAGSRAIAAAMDEQNATTGEVARSIQQAATGTNEVTANIAGVERAAQASSNAAVQVLSSATGLSQQAELLRGQVRTFLTTVRAA
ncbi:HAMP domain-containing methyl-accepting chemotaxis protein [Xanthobacter sp. VNH20]|uniref:methyl-accepting chemotaxis protein n=1 Tax=Xanthobacter sp. VNH20 TaxID=3156616 RepID=UPI0032B3F6F5